MAGKKIAGKKMAGNSVFVASMFRAVVGVLCMTVISQGEAADQAAERHQRVAERREQVHIICHRGSSEFAHENTLEAFRASFELGADGNEIDIRITKDGVLVCFHDDMLDHLLEAFGDVSDYTWEELQRFRFRKPGKFGEQCRIPTLKEVLELHREYAGLMHLDIKRPNMDQAIGQLLDQLDMWDHVAYCNLDNGGSLLKDARLRLCQYKAGLYLDRSEVFPDAIAGGIQKPGNGLIVDDPRGAIVKLGRKLGRVSDQAVSPRSAAAVRSEPRPPDEAELLRSLRDDRDWNQVAETPAERLNSGQRILARAKSADLARQVVSPSPELFAALEDRVRRRSLHKDWQYHGLDGAMALQSLILLRAPQATETARWMLWRDDPDIQPVVNPQFNNPRSWTDFRVKMLAFPALAQNPGSSTEKLCRDYLALSDEEARQIGPQLFEEAAKTLLAVSPQTETAAELMRHRLQVVRGRAILDCLSHGDQSWSRAALSAMAPHALEYLTN